MNTTTRKASLLSGFLCAAGFSLVAGLPPATAHGQDILDKVSSAPIAQPPSNGDALLAPGNPPLPSRW